MQKARGENCRKLVLSIDSYEQSEIKGSFFKPGIDKGAQSFESLIQFLLDVEKLCDENESAHSYEARKSFSKQSSSAQLKNIEDFIQRGKLGTFTIKIIFRQYTSWQGSIIWHEGGDERVFRSVLELIMLIDSALRCNAQAKAV